MLGFRTLHVIASAENLEKLTTSSDEIPDPVAVRFGWHQEAEPNLSNREGLPASPFRTDRW